MPSDRGFYHSSTLSDSRRFSAKRVLCASWRCPATTHHMSGLADANRSILGQVACILLPMSRISIFGFPRLKPPWGASAETLRLAEKSAKDHPVDKYFLPQLDATEQNPDWHLLSSHCLRNQIRPEMMRRMRRSDLEYIAAHSGIVMVFRDGELVQHREEKLRENAERARYVLERRDRLRAASWTTFLAAAVGGAAGAAVSGLIM